MIYKTAMDMKNQADIVELFLEDKEGEFLHLPTGQAFFVKKTN